MFWSPVPDHASKDEMVAPTIPPVMSLLLHAMTAHLICHTHCATVSNDKETTAPTFHHFCHVTVVTTFPYSELLQYLFYSLLRFDHSWLIPYDILTVLSVSLTADFPFIDYFSHDYSSWLITYDILSQIDLVCVPDPLIYKPSVQTVFFSFDLG